MHAAVPPGVHDDYGASYPLTYQFVIPPSSSGLTGQWRADPLDAWTALDEPGADREDGIAMARFDYTGNKAYLSVPFAEDSDDLYLRVMDGSTEVGLYSKITRYYDNRQCAVVITHDDWYNIETHHDSFLEACAVHQNARVWMSPGVNGGHVAPDGLSPTQWSEMDSAVAAGWVEPTNHGLTHISADDYADQAAADAEIIAGAEIITDNVTMPPQSRRGVTQYVHGFIEPYGASNAFSRASLAAAGHLSDRNSDEGATTFSVFAGDDVYGRSASTVSVLDFPGSIPGGAGESNSGRDEIKAAFDTARAAGRIFIVHTYPVRWPSRGVGSAFRNWVDYIGSFDDIWSVGWGHLYQYRRLYETVTTSLT